MFRGQIGYGGITGGNLIDDDYVSAAGAAASGTSVGGAHRFSRAASPADGSSLWYVNADLGYRLLAFQGRRGHLDAFVGYQLWCERVVAEGVRQLECTVVGVLCDPEGTTSFEGVPAVTNTSRWQSLRVGLDSSIPLASWLDVRVNAAFVPWSALLNEDIHHLRFDLGQNPSFAATGTGMGYNLEGELRIRLPYRLTAAMGYRYWYQCISNGELQGFTAREPSFSAP